MNTIVEEQKYNLANTWFEPFIPNDFCSLQFGTFQFYSKHLCSKQTF